MTCRAAGTGDPEARISWDLKIIMYGGGYIEVGGFISNVAKETLKCEEEETLTTEVPKKCLEAIKVSGSGTPLKTTGRESERAAPSQWRQEQKAAAKKTTEEETDRQRRRELESRVIEERKLMSLEGFFHFSPGSGMLSVARKPGSRANCK